LKRSDGWAAVGAALLLAAAPGAGRLEAQRSGPAAWAPLGSRLDALAAWLVTEGALPGLDPLTRPYRMAALRRAAQAADTALLAPAARRALGWLRSELDAARDTIAVSLELGHAAYGNGRRDSFREGGGAGGAVMGGAWVGLARGPFTVVMNPAFENRLKDDPEYTGKTDRSIAGRLQAGYAALSGPAGDLFVGRMARNWGPAPFDGLQVSPSAYATDLLAAALRVGRLELFTAAQRLDDLADSAAPGVPFTRWFLAHRLTVRAGRGIWLAFSETGVYGGPGRGFEPAMHAPLNPALLSQFNENRSVNLLWGVEAHAPLARGIALQAAAAVDDLQIDRRIASDRRPWSGGLSAVVSAALPIVPLQAALGYTQVRSLTYRNALRPLEVYSLAGVGLARNYSDYDQLILRLSYRPSARALVAADLGYLRQGSYDLRQPFPPDSVLATPGKGFLVKPVRTAGAARVGVEIEPWRGLVLNGELTANGAATGPAEVTAAVAARVRYDAARRAFGGVWPAVERGFGRPWP
jgi:hypothetical protein